ncbi:MAG: DUF4157 domain-containing protein [Phycisphaerales bacterium]
MQQAIGNRATQNLLAGGLLQPKLRIGPVNDVYEREADRTAQRIMRMPVPDSDVARPLQAPISRVQRMCTECEEEQIQRKCAECEEEDEKLRRQVQDEEEEVVEKEDDESLQRKAKALAAPRVDAGVESHIASLRGGGQPLPPAARSFFEPRFNHDFSDVRLHTGATAAGAAAAINARAFTLGRDIVFGAGQYTPKDQAGRRLLAHELTHVVQQGAGGKAVNSAGSNLSLKRSPDARVMRKGFESTVKICHRVLTSRDFKVTKGGVRVVLLIEELDKKIPNCKDFTFGVTLTKKIDWWPDDEIATCKARTAGIRSFSFANLSAGTYYLTIWRIFDHPYCCLKGDILVFDEKISSNSSNCIRDKDPSVLDIVHGALDIAGFIPGIGVVADGVNAIVYAAEGDWTSAGISVVAMVPVFGDGAKLASKAGKELIEVSGKTMIKKGKKQLAADLKKVAVNKAAKQKASKEAAARAAKKKAGKEAAEKGGEILKGIKAGLAGIETTLKSAAHRQKRAAAWVKYQKRGGKRTKAAYEKVYDTLTRNRLKGNLAEVQFARIMKGKPKNIWVVVGGKRTLRKVDNVLGNTAREIKSGPLKNTPFIRKQILKDIELIKTKSMKVEWHLLAKGNDANMIAALKKAGITVKLY